ncbi:hypothetical protein CANCADRAFT_1529 [Tortispora caseinolytica NRRL Y-17796]|uniref:PHD-type domain-containing protein n=1 Tax=Tortispora caseinolytica NRRL Y-17796 TaxID=767744 RepID=A0A1E4TMG0_9ASCO|nr:hypothetical protein CANCADRAFT_1529 [Tortispora caseinolytica NRRL Y-17796]
MLLVKTVDEEISRLSIERRNTAQKIKNRSEDAQLRSELRAITQRINTLRSTSILESENIKAKCGLAAEMVQQELRWTEDQLREHKKGNIVDPPSSISRVTTRTLRARAPSTLEANESYCLCGQGSYGEMVACDYPKCKREWFHLECVGLKSAPTTKKWYCPECKHKAQKQKKQRKR